MLSYWLLWIILGLILIFIEIFTHKFIFFSIGLSAIITGMFNILGIEKFIILLIVFLLLTVFNIFFLRKIVSKYLIKHK